MGVTAKTDREQDRNRENTTGTMKHVDTGTDREGGSDELEVAQALRLVEEPGRLQSMGSLKV